MIREGAAYMTGAALPSDQIIQSSEGLALRVDPELEATLMLSEAVWPGSAAEIRRSPAWASRAVVALERAMDLGEEDAPAAWTFTPTPLGIAAHRSGQASFLLDESAFTERLNLELALPNDFTVGLGTTPVTDATPLLDPFLLSGYAEEAQLFHEDPSRLAHSGALRRRLTAWLLMALGIVTVAAALIAARALRRERRLAEMRSTFVAGISHDLRTPLASILLMAENLRSGRVGQDRTTQYAAGITSEAERLRRRVDDILDFARIERGEPTRALREDVELHELVNDILSLCGRQATEAGFQFDGQAAGIPSHAELDSDALRRIAGNLVQNALRHSGGGSVTVRFGLDGDTLLLTVEDDGCGIPAKDRLRVLAAFERLGQDLNPKGGTGLGLAIVAGLVDAHHGSLRVDDPPTGSGVRFTVRLPLEEGPA